MKSSDWISVKDRLPKKNKRVMVCKTFSDKTSFVTIATYTGKEKIHDLDHYWWYTDDGFDIDAITHWQQIVLPKKEKAMKNTVVIHGIKYKAVDSKQDKQEIEKFTCKDCDIYKARIPQSMRILPLCLEDKYIKVNESCCEQFEKGIKRIWKKV